MVSPRAQTPGHAERSGPVVSAFSSPSSRNEAAPGPACKIPATCTVTGGRFIKLEKIPFSFTSKEFNLS